MAISKSRLGRGLGNLIAGGISGGAKPTAPAAKPAPAKKPTPVGKSAPAAKAKPASKPAPKPSKPVAGKPAAKSSPAKPAAKPARPAAPAAKPTATKTPAPKPAQGKPAAQKAAAPAAKTAAQSKPAAQPAAPAAAKPEARASAPAAQQTPPAKVAEPAAKAISQAPAAPAAAHSAPAAKPTAQPPVAATAAGATPVVKPTTAIPPQVQASTAAQTTTATAAAHAPSHTAAPSTQAQPSATPAQVSATAAQPQAASTHGTTAHGGHSADTKAASISTPAAAAGSHSTATAAHANAQPSGTAAAHAAAAPASSYREIAVSVVVPNPYQPRREMDPEHIAELANSIASEGLLQPIVVRPLEGGKSYELIAGERRWRAHQKLGLKTIAARVMDASDSSSAVISLIENIQRQALNPIEEALGFASLMRDFDLTQEAVSERIGRARASIANALRLLALDREIQGYVAKGILSVGHAKILLSVEEPAQRLLIARRIIETGISVRDTETLVRKLKNEKHSRALTGAASPNTSEADRTAIADLEKQLSSRLNTRVQLRHTPKKGRIVIEYYGNEDLQRILERTGLQL